MLHNFSGHRERETGAAPGRYCGQVQRDMEFPTGERWVPRMLSESSGIEKLLLLQDSPKRRLDCR